ncbi:hypothetical protein FZC74_15015 [Sutcliffiella horikoshii]|uniref:Uncharacterized protein n=1 Tax=Sutcliffiella horikoshii TaxID=79883 RepID=A0AA94WPA5_9BACI|nr:hypothetical protein [Sutcliffiella horikoshii]TYS57737.1 hypothetical protein FZC74_15015 [Sutcliffiella horikoshii]
MNVRNSLIFSLAFLFLLLFPTIGFAEKGANQAEGNGKPAEKHVVDLKKTSKIAESKGNGKSVSSRNENAKVTTSKAESSKADHSKKPELVSPHNEKQPEPSKKLPDQANEKAKEARMMKTEKVKKSNPNRPIHKVSKPKSETVMIIRGFEPIEQVQIEHLQDSSANRSVNSFAKESLKNQEINSVNIVANDDIPLENLPEQFPKKESQELFISQTKPSGSNLKGQSSDQKVSSKSIVDLIANSLEEIRVNFLQPYVMRQHIYRDQWVNAPPAPPPENALFF